MSGMCCRLKGSLLEGEPPGPYPRAGALPPCGSGPCTLRQLLVAVQSPAFLSPSVSQSGVERHPGLRRLNETQGWDAGLRSEELLSGDASSWSGARRTPGASMRLVWEEDCGPLSSSGAGWVLPLLTLYLNCFTLKGTNAIQFLKTHFYFLFYYIYFPDVIYSIEYKNDFL